MTALAIDPGLDGALVLFNGKTLKHWDMPIIQNGKSREIDFRATLVTLNRVKEVYRDVHVFLERAVAFGMGTTSAFNYGRGFAMVEVAVMMTKLPVTYVEPAKWAKVMHAGINKELKGKAKSLIAVQRLYPNLIESLPKNRNGKLYDGHVDALLIAGYGLKCLQGAPIEDDFY